MKAIIKKQSPIIIIMIISILIRIIGLNFGLPNYPQPDEPVIMDQVIKMIQTSSFKPDYIGWPGTFLVYFFIFPMKIVYFFLKNNSTNSILNILNSYHNNISYYFLVGRIFIMIFSVISIYFLYKLSFIVTKKKNIAILASILLCISPLYTEHSRYIRPDITSVMFVLISLFSIIKYLKNEKLKYLLISGLTAGISIACKYTSGVILFPLIYAILKQKINKKILIRISILIFTIVVGFLIFNPYHLIEPINSINKIKNEIGGKRFGHERSPGILNVLWYLNYPIKMGIPGIISLIGMISGIIIDIYKNKKIARVIFLFPLMYFIGINFLLLKWIRWLIPILPFFAYYNSITYLTIYDKIKLLKTYRNQVIVKVITVLFLFIIISPIFIKSINNSMLLTKKDTRVITKEWIYENIPNDSKIAYEYPNPALQINNSKYKLVDYAINWRNIVEDPIELYLEEKVDYIILADSVKEIYYQNKNKYKIEIERYKELQNNHKLIMNISNKYNPGPSYKIYKLIYNRSI